MDGYGITNKIVSLDQEITTRVCFKCKIKKEKSEFYKSKHTKCGLRYECKICSSGDNKRSYRDNIGRKKEYDKRYYKNNASKKMEYSKQHYQNNADEIKEKRKQCYIDNIDKQRGQSRQYYGDNKYERIKYSRQYRKNNPNKIIKFNKQYREDNPDKVKEYSRQYRKNNPDKIKKYNRQYRKEKYWTDPIYRIKQNLRSGLRRVIKHGSKTKILKDYLGCTVEEFKQHLEKQFVLGMSWDNYGYDTWHIDHIIPMATIKSENDIEQIKIVCHYTNLQPLWVSDHKIKTAMQIKERK